MINWIFTGMNIESILTLEGQGKVLLTDFVITEFLKEDWVFTIPVKKGHCVTHEEIIYEVIDFLSVTHINDGVTVDRLALVVKKR